MFLLDVLSDIAYNINVKIQSLENALEKNTMAKNLQVGEEVYVPRHRIGLNENDQSAIYKG